MAPKCIANTGLQGETIRYHLKKGGITSMLRYLPVRKIHARQVLDSRGDPTVEVGVPLWERES